MSDDIVVIDNGQTYETQETSIVAKEEADRAERWAKFAEEQANLASGQAIEAAEASDAAAQAATVTVENSNYVKGLLDNDGFRAVASDMLAEPSFIKTALENANNAAADAENAEESATIASQQAEDAQHWAEDSRVWATGEDAEVEEIAPGEEEHSSRGYADLAMAIANSPEDVPVDASGLAALKVIQGPKGDPGTLGEGDIEVDGIITVKSDGNHPIIVQGMAGATASGYQIIDSLGNGETDLEHYNTGDRYGSRLANRSTATSKEVHVDLYQTNAGKSIFDATDVDNVLVPTPSATDNSQRAVNTEWINANMDYVVESYNSGLSWYKIYSNGWIEQGGFYKNTTTGVKTINLLKEMKDTNYSIIGCYGDSSELSNGAVSFYPKNTTSFDIRPYSGDSVFWEVKGYMK